MYGFDKYENEELIKYHTPNSIWFHVDSFSSAHIYCLLPDGMTFDTIPQDLIDECAQLTKYNSIEGNKKNNITVCYTPADNLLKTGDMEVGAVGFKNQKLVKRYFVQEKNPELVRYFKKHATENHNYNYAEERQKYIQKQLNEEKRKKKEYAQLKKQMQKMEQERKKEKEANSIMRIFDNYQDQVEQNQEVDFDDFM